MKAQNIHIERRAVYFIDCGRFCSDHKYDISPSYAIQQRYEMTTFHNSPKSNIYRANTFIRQIIVIESSCYTPFPIPTFPKRLNWYRYGDPRLHTNPPSTLYKWNFSSCVGAFLNNERRFPIFEDT